MRSEPRSDGGRLFATRPIGVRLGIVGLILVVLATVWFVVWREWTRIETTAFESAARDAQNLTRAVAQHANRTIAQVDEVIREVAYRLRHGERLDLTELHTRVPGLDEVSRFIGVMDLQGKARTSSLTGAIGADYGDREWFRQAMAQPGETVLISPPIVGRVTGEVSIPLSLRVDGPDGQPLGVVMASILSGYFTSFFSSLDLGRNGSAAMVGIDGMIYARRAPGDPRVGERVPDLLVLRSLHLGDRGVVTGISAVDGVERLLSYEKLRHPGLLVFTALAVEDIRAGFAAGRRTVLLQGVVITALVMLLAGITLHYLGRIEEGQIVARETLAAAVRARNEAEEANAAKSQFLATASHELRTPLNAILGFSEIMERELFGPLGSPRYREYMRDIRDSGYHLLALINDLLDLAKIEAGRLDLQLEPVDMSALAQNCARLMQARAAEAGVALQVRAEPGILVMADKLKIKQIALNLLSNAVKFTPKGGQVELSVVEADGTVILAVRDTGLGMSAEEVRIALEPFGQLDSRISEEREGTGLGLPLAKGLAELHGGSLTIDSLKGAGTTVTVRIPSLRPDDGQETVPITALLSARNG